MLHALLPALCVFIFALAILFHFDGTGLSRNETHLLVTVGYISLLFLGVAYVNHKLRRRRKSAGAG